MKKSNVVGGVQHAGMTVETGYGDSMKKITSEVKKFLLLALVIIIVTGVFLAGCKSGETTTAPSPITSTPSATTTEPPATMTTPPATTPSGTVKPEPPRGPGGVPLKPDWGKDSGRLKLAGEGDINNIGNPDETNNPTDSEYAWPAIETLITTDAAGNYKPWLAKGWDITDDGSSITFYLQGGVKYHDGTPFDASAVKLNIDIQINTTAWQDLKMVRSVEVIDDYTVKLDLERWDWTMMNSLSGFFACGMYSPTALMTQSAEWLRSHPVGTGPFKVVSYKQGEKLSYDRFDDYWRGRPYLGGVDFIFVPGSEQTLSALRDGKVHATKVSGPDSENLESRDFKIFQSEGWIVSLYPDARNPDSPFSDIKIRQAINYAIDKQKIADELGYGYSRPCDQVFLRESGGWNPDVIGFTYDVDEAKRLLAEAGYPNGFETELLIEDFISLDAPLLVQEMLREVDIVVRFNRVNTTQFRSQITEGYGWDGLCWVVSPEMTESDPSDVILNGVLNNNTTWAGLWQPDDLLVLANQAAAETNQEKRMALYREISGDITDTYCLVANIYDITSLTAVSSIVKGHTLDERGFGQFPYTFAWIME